MLRLRLSPPLQARCRRGFAALVLGLGGLAAPPGWADPGTEPRAAPGDAVLQLLQERGLVPSKAALDENETLRQVRQKASELVLAAMDFIGVPYKRGGNSAEQGFDCSGFTRHVFEQSLGLILPRRADQQAKSDELFVVKREDLKPGDLVFFNTMRRAFSHVGIYVGDGRFIHAPRAGGQVRIESMREAYWERRFNGARRADAMAPALLAAPPMAAASGAGSGPEALR
jgi:cell wall-associated NlpC family hydrolase